MPATRESRSKPVTGRLARRQWRLPVEQRDLDGVPLLVIRDRFDLEARVWLDVRVEDAVRRGCRNIAVDFGHVADLEREAIPELVRLYESVRAARGTLRLLGATAPVRKTLRERGLEHMLAS